MPYRTHNRLNAVINHQISARPVNIIISPGDNSPLPHPKSIPPRASHGKKVHAHCLLPAGQVEAASTINKPGQSEGNAARNKTIILNNGNGSKRCADVARCVCLCVWPHQGYLFFLLFVPFAVNGSGVLRCNLWFSVTQKVSTARKRLLPWCCPLTFSLSCVSCFAHCPVSQSL